MKERVLCAIDIIDRVNGRVGETVRWLVVVIPVITVGYALVRKLTDWGHNGMTELQWFLFAWVFLVGGAYTLLRDEHIRVDVLRERFPLKVKCWIDIAMHVLLVIPACTYMAWHYWFFWTHSLVTSDGPEDVLTGLNRWPLKLALFLGFSLLALQCVAEVLRRMSVLRGWLSPSVLNHQVLLAFGKKDAQCPSR